MAAKRIIKKYPNRRLYDTEISKYITLADVRKLVLNGAEFMVTDVKSGEDLTKNILMQIIAEQEHGDDSVFSTAALTQIIRSYKNAHENLLSDYLQKCLEIYDRQSRVFQKEIQSTLSVHSLGSIAELTEKNLEAWKRIQERFFQATGIYPGMNKADD